MRKWLGARLARADDLADGRGDESGIRDRRKGDEQHTVRERGFDLSGDREREPGLADAAWPGQRDEAHVGAQQEVSGGGDLRLAANERGKRDW